MNTYLIKLLALLPMGLLIGCNAGIYVPAHQNVPLLRKKGEVQVLLNTTNIQAAAAVSNHIGIAVNAQAVINERDFLAPASRFIANQRRVELAVGYFTRQKTPKHPILELYVGGGIGRASQRWAADVWVFSSPGSTSVGISAYQARLEVFDTRNLYVQPAIGVRRGMRSLSFSTKINYTSYTNATTQPVDAFPILVDPAGFVDRLRHTHTLFLEPAITGAIGGKIVRVSLQGFYWLPVINQSGLKEVSHNQTFVRLGLALRLNQRQPQQNPTENLKLNRQSFIYTPPRKSYHYSACY